MKSKAVSQSTLKQLNATRAQPRRNSRSLQLLTSGTVSSGSLLDFNASMIACCVLFIFRRPFNTLKLALRIFHCLRVQCHPCLRLQ